LITAAPTTPAFVTEIMGNIHLAHDKVLLHGNGRFQIINRWEVDKIKSSRAKAVAPPQSASLDDSVFTYMGNAENPWDINNHTTQSASKLQKRGKDTIVIPWPNEPRFMGWDVAMCLVVKGGPEKETIMAVMAGTMIGNSIAVGVTTDFKVIAEFLSVHYRVYYTRTWITLQQNEISSTVPPNKFGTIISNPWTYREKGWVWEGTVGESQNDVGQPRYHYADRFSDRSYDHLSWVDGQINPCIGDEYPLKRCLGEGTF